MDGNSLQEVVLVTDLSSAFGEQAAQALSGTSATCITARVRGTAYRMMRKGSLAEFP